MNYHKYIFNDQGLVGDFEGMYAAEDTEKFDSWRGDDTRHLRMRLVRDLLEDYNFPSVLDVGCGKGTQTQFLKKQNNKVVGIDFSETAIEKARATFPDIEFIYMNATEIRTLSRLFNLTAFQTVLAYIPEWEKLLRSTARFTDYCLVAEYIPSESKGAIKDCWQLMAEFDKSFDIKHEVILDNEFIILFGKVK